MKDCIQCGTRKLSQFRRRRSGALAARCKRCTKLNTRRKRWLSRLGDNRTSP